jgi:hypothetical protein
MMSTVNGGNESGQQKDGDEENVNRGDDLG